MSRDPLASPPGLPAHTRPPGARGLAAVVIGSSAGGIEVLNTLIAALSAQFPAPVVIVTHMPPETPSYLAQTFSYRSALPVLEPDAGEALEAGRLYVAPPGYHMLIEDDQTVALSIEGAVRFSRPSIDVLFESAARAYRGALLGILLSGANDDGAAGLATIRRLGGVAWAQEPSTASSPEMPLSAIERGAVDEILTPETMAQRLARLTANSRTMP